MTSLNSDSSMELDSRLVKICRDSFVLFFAVDIAPFQEFFCLTIKVAVHQRTESHQEAIGFVLLDFTQLKGDGR